ncbi:hypothetical protein DFJ74DRAFT_431207 [Hyaloraphidium curvatum]|nr:hypothetical protein DFJ74DRAFT_431207 [Hyaloraphidium curvatum]
MSLAKNRHSAVAVENIPGRGRGLVASKSLAHGTLLFEEAPFAAVIDDAHAATHCSACFRELAAESKLRCSGCRFPHYCSAACQKSDWAAGHKAECLGLRKVAPRRPPTSVRLVARVLERRAREPGAYEASGMAGLEGHRADLGQDELESFAQLAFVVTSILSPAAAEAGNADVLDVIARFSCNAMSLTAPGSDLVNVGVAMLPFSALANHSCAPDAALMYVRDGSGVRAQVRTITGVAAGEEICLSYIPSEVTPRKERIEALRKQYRFTCTCPACSAACDPLAALRCAKCAHEFEVLPGDAENVFCPVCGSFVVAAATLGEALAEAAVIFAARDRGELADPAAVRACLEKLEGLRCLGERHFGPLGLRTLLYDLLISRGEYAEAYGESLRISKILQPPFVAEFHPARTLRLLLTAKLGAYGSMDLDQMRDLADRALRGVKVAFGEGEFYRRCLDELGLST